MYGSFSFSFSIEELNGEGLKSTGQRSVNWTLTLLKYDFAGEQRFVRAPFTLPVQLSKVYLRKYIGLPLDPDSGLFREVYSTGAGHHYWTGTSGLGVEYNRCWLHQGRRRA
jgi:hypothetical protein